MSHFRRRPLLSRVLPLGLAATLVAGAALSGYAVGGRALAGSPKTTLRIWYGTDDPTEQALTRALVQRFEARHPTVDVSLTTYGLDDLNTKMQLALSAGNPPDLVYTTPRGPGLPAYVRAGKLLDLSAAARKDGWAARLRPGLLDEYNRLLAANSRSSAERSAGRIYAVPYVLAAVAVLYNKTLFAKLHLAIPTSVTALAQTAARVQKAGYVPFGLGNADGWVGDDWWLTLVNARLGPAPLRPALELDPRFSFQGPAYHWASATLQSWSRQNYFTPDFGGLDAQDSVEAFFEGKTAMQLVSSTQNPQILSLARESKLDVGIFPFPSYDGRQPPVMPQSGYAGWAIPRASHDVADALAFIDDMTSQQTAALLLEHGLLPAQNVRNLRPAAAFQREYLAALQKAVPGVYLDSAPVPNINATMEANVQLLLQDVEAPDFLSRSLDEVYKSYGAKAASTRTDGEF